MPRFKFGGMFGVSFTLYFTYWGLQRFWFGFWLIIAEFLTAVRGATRQGQQYKKFPKKSHCRSREWSDFQVMLMNLDREWSMIDRWFTPEYKDMVVVLRHKCGMSESARSHLRKWLKLFSPIAVDKPVEKPLNFFMAYCFSEKNYPLPKK